MKRKSLILLLNMLSLLFCAYAQEGTLVSPQPAPQPAPTQQQSEQFQQWLQNNAPTPTPTTTAAPATVVGGSSPTTLPPMQRPNVPPDYEQGQQIMLNSIPPDSPAPTVESKAAFQAMLQQNMPLTPQQVVLLRQNIDMAQRAASILPNIPPKPVSTTLMVNLAPGTTPPAVRLAQGYVSSLVFVDSTGAPWPIAAFDIGNPKAVNIQWDGKGSILLIQAVAPYFNGNMVVRLVGLPTPITLEMVTGQRVVDYRVDIHVSGLGPNTKEMPMGTPLPASANQLLLGVLDGVAPAGSKELTVRGTDSQAWLVGNKLYLRTRFNVLSPGWIGKMTSPDGMIAYEMNKTSSILISRYGEPAEIKIEGL